MVGHHPTNKLIGREPIPHQKHPKAHLSHTHHAAGTEYPVLATLSCGYPEEGGRLLTCYSPVRHSSRTSKLIPSPFDLHVLSTPPAFVLSQDQTLQTKPTKPGPNQPQTSSQPEPTVSTTVQKTRPGPTQPPQQREPGKPKQNKPQKPHKQAQPPGPWHKKHDTLSSSQTTHPPRFKTRKNSLLASRRRPD